MLADLECVTKDGRIVFAVEVKDRQITISQLRAKLRTIREKLFATPLDTVITLVIAFLLWRAAVPLFEWFFADATFAGSSRADCTGAGACWVFVRARFGQFMYGLYPPSERWRVDLAGIILVVSIALLCWKALPWRRAFAVALFVVLPPLGIWLLAGGFGLRPVETREWGGLMLTIFISIYAGLIAIPLGILLALGRQSRLPVIRTISVIFIEFWRGVPIVAVIFLASILLPLIMPSGVGVDRLARVRHLDAGGLLGHGDRRELIGLRRIGRTQAVEPRRAGACRARRAQSGARP